MSQRRRQRFCPVLEPLEVKRPLSAGAAALPDLAESGGAAGSRATHRAEVAAAHHAAMEVRIAARAGNGGAGQSVSAMARKPAHGFLVYRITNPNPFNDTLTPPFTQVLVQKPQPVPGQKYNILFVSVRNGTARTFDADDGFQVKFPGQRDPTPILTGDQQWKPGQTFVFYLLTKKYYPAPNVVSSGFQFNLDHAFSVAIPGPSGIFVGLTYRPATFHRTLDRIVAYGNGAQGGKGPKLGLPDTSIYEFLSAKTNRIDFSGYF